MLRKQLDVTIEEARKSLAYQNYLDVRRRVLEMLEEGRDVANSLSDYWKEELDGFDYMLDAPPLVIRKLREHCYHLTGLRSYEYRQHHIRATRLFKGKLEALQGLDNDGLFVPESPELGGFGHAINGALANIDTLKFYESLIVLNRATILPEFRRADGQRKVVMEIGAGWGGFAYQFKTLCPTVCYIAVDLPQTLLFSAVYLKTLFPEASCLIYGDKPAWCLPDGYAAYDFIFLPHYFFPRLESIKIDLAINMVSFQEMTSTQVDTYVRRLAELGCPRIYSHNRDRSKYNTQLTAVSDILRCYYEVNEDHLLGVPYNILAMPRKDAFSWPKTRDPKAFIRQLLKSYLRATEVRTPSPHQYRHLIGTKA